MNINYFRVVALISIIGLLVIIANIDTIKYNHLDSQEIFCNNSRAIVEMDGYERKCAFSCNYEYKCELKHTYFEDKCYCGNIFLYDDIEEWQTEYYIKYTGEVAE